VSTWAEPYLDDLGPDDANISDHDVWTHGVPHATFARLRREEPVAWIDEVDGRGYWAITKYDDAFRISRDVQTFTSSKGIRLEDMAPDELEAAYAAENTHGQKTENHNKQPARNPGRISHNPKSGENLTDQANRKTESGQPRAARSTSWLPVTVSSPSMNSAMR